MSRHIPCSRNGTTLRIPNTTKANTAVANTTSWVAGGSGNYNALIVDLRHDLAHGLQVEETLPGRKTSTTVQRGTRRSHPTLRRSSKFLHCRISITAQRPPIFAMQQQSMLPTSYPSVIGKTLFANVGHAAEALLSGWSLSSIANLSSGLPFSPQLGYNPTGSGDSPQPGAAEPQHELHRATVSAEETPPRALPSTSTQMRFPLRRLRNIGNVGPRFPGRARGTGTGMLSLLKSTQVTERPACNFAPSSSTW